MKVFLLYFLVFLVFFIKGTILLEPDLGWHLRMGQIITSSGIPQNDPLSYTMASFPFVDHEWLTNVFMFSIYPYGGQILISLVFSLVFISINWLLFGKMQKFGSVPVFILVNATLLSFFLAAPKIFSWFFVAVFLKIILDEKRWDRFKFLLPILLLLWTNLHGSFAIGVMLVLMMGLIRVFQRKFTPSDVLVMICAVFVTFVNPYRDRIWEEIFRQFFDPNLKSEIAEWRPGIFFEDIPLWSLFILSVLLPIYDLKPKLIKHSIRIRKILPNEQVLICFFLVLLYAAFSTYRHIPFWIILVGPILLNYLGQFKESFNHDKFALKAIPKVVRYATIIIIFFSILEVFVNYYSANAYSEKIFYPQKAVEVLKAKPPVGQIFSLYGWGGYLDWNLPEKSVFIDGRMPSWKWSAPENESDWALGDYFQIIEGQDMQTYFQKYHITYVLWPTSKKPDFFVGIRSKVMETIGVVFNVNSVDPSAAFLNKLQKTGWKVIYQDENAIVLTKSVN